MGMKNCAWCGSSNVSLDTFNFGKDFQVDCEDCLLSSPFFKTSEEAINTWNLITFKARCEEE